MFFRFLFISFSIFFLFFSFFSFHFSFSFRFLFSFRFSFSCFLRPLFHVIFHVHVFFFVFLFIIFLNLLFRFCFHFLRAVLGISELIKNFMFLMLFRFIFDAEGPRSLESCGEPSHVLLLLSWALRLPFCSIQLFES